MVYGDTPYGHGTANRASAAYAQMDPISGNEDPDPESTGGTPGGRGRGSSHSLDNNLYPGDVVYFYGKVFDAHSWLYEAPTRFTGQITARRLLYDVINMFQHYGFGEEYIQCYINDLMTGQRKLNDLLETVENVLAYPRTTYRPPTWMRSFTRQNLSTDLLSQPVFRPMLVHESQVAMGMRPPASEDPRYQPTRPLDEFEQKHLRGERHTFINSLHTARRSLAGTTAMPPPAAATTTSLGPANRPFTPATNYNNPQSLFGQSSAGHVRESHPRTYAFLEGLAAPMRRGLAEYFKVMGFTEQEAKRFTQTMFDPLQDKMTLYTTGKMELLIPDTDTFMSLFRNAKRMYERLTASTPPDVAHASNPPGGGGGGTPNTPSSSSSSSSSSGPSGEPNLQNLPPTPSVEQLANNPPEPTPRREEGVEQPKEYRKGAKEAEKEENSRDARRRRRREKRLNQGTLQLSEGESSESEGEADLSVPQNTINPSLLPNIQYTTNRNEPVEYYAAEPHEDHYLVSQTGMDLQPINPSLLPNIQYTTNRESPAEPMPFLLAHPPYGGHSGLGAWNPLNYIAPPQLPQSIRAGAGDVPRAPAAVVAAAPAAPGGGGGPPDDDDDGDEDEDFDLDADNEEVDLGPENEIDRIEWDVAKDEFRIHYRSGNVRVPHDMTLNEFYSLADQIGWENVLLSSNSVLGEGQYVATLADVGRQVVQAAQVAQAQGVAVLAPGVVSGILGAVALGVETAHNPALGASLGAASRTIGEFMAGLFGSAVEPITTVSALIAAASTRLASDRSTTYVLDKIHSGTAYISNKIVGGSSNLADPQVDAAMQIEADKTAEQVGAQQTHGHSMNGQTVDSDEPVGKFMSGDSSSGGGYGGMWATNGSSNTSAHSAIQKMAGNGPMGGSSGEDRDIDMANSDVVKTGSGLVGEENLPRENQEANKPLMVPVSQRGREQLSEAYMAAKQSNLREQGDMRERANMGRGAPSGFGVPKKYPGRGGVKDDTLRYVKGMRMGKQSLTIWKSSLGSKGKKLSKHNVSYWAHNPDSDQWTRIYGNIHHAKYNNPPFAAWEPEGFQKDSRLVDMLGGVYAQQHAIPGNSKPAQLQAPTSDVSGKGGMTISKDPYKQTPLPGHY